MSASGTPHKRQRILCERRVEVRAEESREAHRRPEGSKAGPWARPIRAGFLAQKPCKLTKGPSPAPVDWDIIPGAMGGHLGSAHSHKVGPLELRLAVVATLMEPALQLAAVLKLPLEDVETLARTGYVRAGKERGLSVRAMARSFKCATATITSIAKRGRDRAIPEILGLDVDRKRRLITLAGDGPFSLSEAVDALGHDEVDVTLAIEELTEARLLAVDPTGRHRLEAHVVNYVAEDTQVRLAGLRQLLEVVSSVVYSRFFTKDPGSFVRAASFKSSSADLDAIRDDVWKTLEPRIRDADARELTGAPKAESIAAFLVAETPHDGVWQSRSARTRRTKEPT